MIKSIAIKNYKKFDQEIKLNFWNPDQGLENKDFILQNKIASVIAIIGKNAAGKSTIIEAISFYASFNSKNFFKIIAMNAYIKKINHLQTKINNDSIPKEEIKVIRDEIEKMITNLPKSGDDPPILKNEIDNLFGNYPLIVSKNML